MHIYGISSVHRGMWSSPAWQRESHTDAFNKAVEKKVLFMIKDLAADSLHHRRLHPPLSYNMHVRSLGTVKPSQRSFPVT